MQPVLVHNAGYKYKKNYTNRNCAVYANTGNSLRSRTNNCLVVYRDHGPVSLPVKSNLRAFNLSW